MCQGSYGQLINKHGSIGRAVIYNQNATFLILVNDVDHLQISLKKSNTSIASVVEEFYKILDTLDRDLKFAYTEELGYVTARPYDLGFTRIEVKVELKDLKKLDQKLKAHISKDYLTREYPNKRITFENSMKYEC